MTIAGKGDGGGQLALAGEPSVARDIPADEDAPGRHGCSTMIIPDTPKRSVTMPKRGEKKVLASGILPMSEG